MGSDRRKYQDKSKAEVSIKLHEEFKLNHRETFIFWKDYQEMKQRNWSAAPTMRILSNEYNESIIFYFAALAMEIVTKEIIEGIELDKKKTKKKRKHLPKLTSLRNKLDKLFNQYIRLRDGACILTGEKENLSCSHYYDKKNNPYLRWDERNAHAMTIKKHWLHHHGKAPDYALWMFKTYGFKFMFKLSKDANRKVKYKREDYTKLIETYIIKISILKGNLIEKN